MTSSSVLRMKVDTLDWPVMILAGLEHGFEILEPRELLDRVRQVGATLTAATAS